MNREAIRARSPFVWIAFASLLIFGAACSQAPAVAVVEGPPPASPGGPPFPATSGTLQEAAMAAGFPLHRPHHELANDDSITDVWIGETKPLMIGFDFSSGAPLILQLFGASNGEADATGPAAVQDAADAAKSWVELAERLARQHAEFTQASDYREFLTPVGDTQAYVVPYNGANRGVITFVLEDEVQVSLYANESKSDLIELARSVE